MIRKRKIKVGPKKRSDMNGKYEKESMGSDWHEIPNATPHTWYNFSFCLSILFSERKIRHENNEIVNLKQGGKSDSVRPGWIKWREKTRDWNRKEKTKPFHENMILIHYYYYSGGLNK